MLKTRFAIIGAGISGLSFADHLRGDDYMILEADADIGGYCKTIEKAGFVWDYSGHFFHFRNPEIERDLVARMGADACVKVERKSKIWHRQRLIDFPFQKNIHQLPPREFLACLAGLLFRKNETPQDFEEFLYGEYGRAIVDKFLGPYNRKLYATELSNLDVDAMGRFFPHTDLRDILSNIFSPQARGYNATFTYPRNGAISYINALAQGVNSQNIALEEAVVSVDVDSNVLTTTKRQVQYDVLINSAPFDRFLSLCGQEVDRSVYSANKVEVFNLGFDKKGAADVHWIYFAQPEFCFYRVGYYDNILGDDKMSLYVEIGRDRHAQDNPMGTQDTLERVLEDLRSANIVDDQRLEAWHHVVLDPAYVHVSRASMDDFARRDAEYQKAGVFNIGRYGSWTYCSIEDNIVQARKLAEAIQ